jgi:hypothetical protein
MNMNPFEYNTVPESSTSGAIEAYSNRAVAEIQAQVILAKRFPRDPKESVDRILRDCGRATLAEKATYTFKRGGTLVTGPSIRLAECVQRGWGNLIAGVKTVERTSRESLMIAYAWDIETNAYYSTEFWVAHTRDTKGGKKDLVEERDIYEMEANQAARRVRTCILKLVPGDVVDAAVEQCARTLAAKIGDIAKARAAMLETFKALGVTKEMIEKRLGHRIESIEPGEIVTMRGIFNSLRDKMATIEDYFEVPKAPEDVVKPTAEQRPAAEQQPAIEQQPTAEPRPQPVEETPPVEELITALEEYLHSDTLPAACVRDITAALTNGEADPEKLSNLLEKTKAAYNATTRSNK